MKSIWDNSDFKRGQSEYLKYLQQANRATSDSTQQMQQSGGEGAAALAGLGAAAGGMTLTSILGLAAGIGILIKAADVLVSSIFNATKAVKDFGVESVFTAGRVQELHLVAQLLGQRAGFTEEQIDKQTQTIKELGIRTDTALTLQSQFARYELDMAKATDLARVAQDAAVIAMADSSDELDNLLYGIITYNKRILRTAGLNVDVQGGFERFAASVGKSADDLTEAEKVQATLNAVIAEGGKIAGTYEAAMLSASKQMRSWKRDIFELKSAAGAPFQGAFLTVAQTLREVTQAITAAISEGGKLYPLMVNLGAVASIMADGFKAGAERITDVAINVIGGLANLFGVAANDALQWGANIIVSLADGMIQGAAAALTYAMDLIGNFLASWLSPGSPPKVAPDLDKWGIAAVNEWLKGFTKGDFDLLKAIQDPLKKALQFLEQTGLIGEGKAGQKFANLSKQLIRQIATGGEIDSALYEKLAKSAGHFGDAIVDLAKSQSELTKATKAQSVAEQELERVTRAQEQAEEDLKAAQEEEMNARVKVTDEVREYNEMLKAGATKEELRAKMAQINASEEAARKATEERKQAELNVDAAEENVNLVKAQVDAAKDYVEAIKEQVAVQKDLVNQLIDLADVQARAREEALKGGGAGAAADALKDAISGLGETEPFEGIQTKIEAAVENAKKLILEKLGEIFAPLKKKWEEDWQPILNSLGEKWLWFTGIVKQFYDQNVAPKLDDLKAKWEEVSTSFKQYYDDNIYPTIQDIVKDLQENVPVALGVMATNFEQNRQKLSQYLNWMIDPFKKFFEEYDRYLVEVLSIDLMFYSQLYDTFLKPRLEIVHDYLSNTFLPKLGELASMLNDTLWNAVETISKKLIEFWLYPVIPLYQGFVNLRDVIGQVASKIGDLADALAKLRGKGADALWPWLFDSPPPLAMGIEAVGDEMKQFVRGALPEFAAGLSLIPAQSPMQVPAYSSMVSQTIYRNVSVDVSGAGGMEEAVLRTIIRQEIRREIG